MFEILFERLKSLREANNLSQNAISKEIGMDQRAYGRYEHGERTPRLEQLVALADFFGVSTDYLLGRTDNPQVNR